MSDKVQVIGDDFYIPKVSNDGIALCGHKLKCNKCKRKILIQLPVTGIPNHIDAFAVCGECLEIHDEFRELYPELAADLQRWKDS